MTLQIRRDTAANWTSVNPVLASGQFGYETDTLRLKIGNGATAWASLPYFSAAASARYRHDQVSSSATWTVNHNLGFRPQCEVFSPGWVQIEAGILHTSDNQTVITFNSAQAGQAIFT